MDSNLRKRVVLLVVLVIGLLTLVVLYQNLRHKTDTTQQPNEESVVTVPFTPQLPPRAQGQIGDDLYAYLDQDAFFDEETDPVIADILEKQKKLFLSINSIEKDLRIQIQNYAGELVTGKRFTVRLNAQDDYTDLDLDGVIYIGDLQPSEVQVELLPIEEYIVTDAQTSASVKERVEYQMISDIALLIRNETQIDAAAEDAQVIDAKAEGDRTQSKTLLETSANVRAGVNLSATNGEIDWEKVKAAGVSFVILRAGYRGVVSGSLIEDAKFAANIQGAQSVGLEVGVSFSSQAHNEVEAVEDASAALHLVAAYDIDFPIFMNLGSVEEVSEAEEFTAAQRTAVVQAFCKTITSSGYRSGVYASKEWLTDKLDVASLSNDSIWLAEYKKVPTYQGYYEIWQHTSEGKVNGISGEVGLNLCYVAYSPPE